MLFIHKRTDISHQLRRKLSRKKPHTEDIVALLKIHSIKRTDGAADRDPLTKIILKSQNPIHAAAAKLSEYLFQGAITEAMTTGVFRWPLHNRWHLQTGEYCDFHGLNYYSRSTVRGLADGVRKNSPRNDLGWEIYPEGLVRCAETLEKRLVRPIWVTENGTCDNHDAFRARYIYEHLEAIIHSGLPFERYYHWCFCDNFEWIEGESARFGLVHVDYATQARTVKRSGTFYADLIENGGVTDAAYEAYVKEEAYRIE